MIEKIKRNAAYDWLKLRLWFKRNLSLILMTVIAVLVGLMFLIMIVQASNARKEVESHREATEALIEQLKDIAENAKRDAEENAKRDQQVHNEIKDFLCELVRLAPPDRITSEQLKLCEGYPPAPGESYPQPISSTRRFAPTRPRSTTGTPTPTPTPAPRPGNSPPPPSTSQRKPEEPAKPKEQTLQNQLLETPSKKPVERVLEQLRLCQHRSGRL